MKKSYLSAKAEIYMTATEDILSSSTDKDNILGVAQGFFTGYEDELEIT